MSALSLEQFIGELAFAVPRTVLALHEGLERAAHIVEHAAKGKIGEYQEASGGFSEWQPLAESTLDEKERLGYAPPDNPLLREGELRDSIQHETHALEAVIGSKSKIAAYQEFGTEHIPPRPFIGPAAVESMKKVEEMIGAAMVVGISGKGVIPSGFYDFEIK